MVYRRLKDDAVPSVWPGLPPHLTKPSPRRNTMANSDARQSNVEAMEVFREETERAIDYITSLSLFCFTWTREQNIAPPFYCAHVIRCHFLWGGGGEGDVSTLRHKFYDMVVNRNELLIMCTPRFPKLKIHFNSDFLHYKELHNKVELNRTHPFKCFGSYKSVEE